MRRWLPALALVALPALAADGRRAVLVTVDDLPVAAANLHADPADRERVTAGLLDALARHKIHAVGLVIGGQVKTPADRALLERWLEAGHELGNHSFSHLDYTRTASDAYIADVERARAELASFLEVHGKTLRFFRFPFLHEGDTPDKLRAMRDYLARTKQRNLPVTYDNQDWSFERPWVEAARRGDDADLAGIADDYHAYLRISVTHHEHRGDELYGRILPQILLLHANAVGAAQWDRLFTWLESTGHRFATADDVLADAVFQEPHDYAGGAGFGLWDRLREARLAREARSDVERLLAEQSAAWNRGDVEAFCSVYVDDALFVSPSGLTRGRNEIQARYKKKYPDRAAMGTLTLEIVEFQPLSGNEVSLLGDEAPGGLHAAIATARWRLTYPDREPASGLTLLVFRRHGDAWMIVEDASM
ncbi:MAG TPA: SgcJ/EcaC family oxidoreductase [Candidatus Polarisedimenticolaceae bacterium]|nr:SgcJ/EcaC family oxidoreductase [Candidatus Polarisedimenticolaceae bacterium]